MLSVLGIVRLVFERFVCVVFGSWLMYLIKDLVNGVIEMFSKWDGVYIE